MPRYYVLAEVVTDTAPNMTLVGSTRYSPDEGESGFEISSAVVEAVFEERRITGEDLADTGHVTVIEEAEYYHIDPEANGLV